MTNPKEPGGWGEMPDQPAGTRDRTFATREAFPRDVEEGSGRSIRPDRGDRVLSVRTPAPTTRADRS
jgi:hypothetical protein